MVKLFVFSFITILLFSCAQKGTLSGGEKDTTGPVILNLTPNNTSTNFQGKKVIFEFDEYIKVQSFKKEVIVSPPLKYGLEYEVKGKKLIITWQDTLQNNTTYSFYFGKSIVDVNERNVLIENAYVFSTGDEIDSLSFKGNIINSWDNLPSTDMMVFLYKSQEDSIVKSALPNYFAKTDESGNFTFNYLAEGEYKLFALSDINSNYLYDLENERIAFQEELVVVPDSNLFVSMRSFVKEDKTTRLGKKKMLYKELIQLGFNRPVEDFQFSFINVDSKKSWWIEDWNENHDSLKLWLNDLPNQDSLVLKLTANELMDTLVFYPERSKSIITEKLKLLASAKSVLSPIDSQIIRFNRPVISIDTLNYKLKIDSISSKNGKLIHQGIGRDFIYECTFPSEKNMELSFPPNSVEDFLGLKNEDSLKVIFKKGSMENYGNLLVNISLVDSASYVVQLIKGKDKVVFTEAFFNKKFLLNRKFMLPGKYGLRIIKDNNSNGKWDAGDYELKQQSESILIFEEEMILRANWDLELEWNVIPKSE